jgi:hypothetical protein
MKKHYRHENDCLNCGTILEGKYCHNCGQENLEVKEGFGHMMNHAISDYFHFDHQFFHTLKPLLFKPGYLTSEYMAGRRVQYLHPIKMYIFISVVYFLVLFQSGNKMVSVDHNPNPANTQKTIDSLKKEMADDKDLSADEKKTIRQQMVKYSTLGAKYSKIGTSKSFSFSGDSTVKQYTEHQNKLPPAKRDGFIEKIATVKLIAYHQKYGERSGEVFNEQLQHNLPKMMFVLLPLFALILGITFRKNKKFYVEHLIYAFHLHCFFFLFFGIILIIEMVLPTNKDINGWIMLATALYAIWYFYRSLRVVYTRNVFRTILKVAGMTITYLLAYVICFLLLLFITAMTIS